jgi:glutamine amidotransferase PdxT
VKILATLQSKPHISALAEVLRVLNLNPSDSSSIPDINAIVAVRQNNILATAFHPELTKDLRWHK